MNCTDLHKALPDLLLDGRPMHGDAATHLDGCVSCGKEYAELRTTFALLDGWRAPEPSPYFDQKLAVRLREEIAAPAAGWFERMRSRLLFNTGAQFRPMLAGTMAAVLLLGGGAFAGLSTLPGHERGADVSATVHDLQILDKNDQALQQMDQLLQDDPSAEDDAAGAPRS